MIFYPVVSFILPYFSNFPIAARLPRTRSARTRSGLADSDPAPFPSNLYRSHRDLEQTAIFQVVFDNYIGYRVEHELDIRRVRSTREMSVHFFRALLIESLKLHLNVRCGFVVRIGPGVLGEADRERRPRDLLLEEIFLVQEENDRSVDEPLVVAYGVEKTHGFHHTVHLVVFGED